MRFALLANVLALTVTPVEAKAPRSRPKPLMSHRAHCFRVAERSGARMLELR